MQKAEQQINRFLVEVFNDVLRLEETSLSQGSCPDLSVSEVHVLEATQLCGDPPSMSTLANRLRITAGTLTVAVKGLEQKGYLERRRCPEDRRRVTVHLTDKADVALAHHAAFHEQMVHGVSEQLTEAQMQELVQTLDRLHTFFSGL